MSTLVATTLLLAITLGLLLLPFLPGFLVLWRKEDATPLRVVRNNDVDAAYFARSFRSYVQTHFEPKLYSASADMVPQESGATPDRNPDLLITHEDVIHFDETELRDREIHRMFVASVNLNLPDDLIFTQELFSKQSVYGGRRNIYRAILADDEIVLGPESMLLRWMHAVGGIRIERDSLLHGRVTSDAMIHLESGCRFERLHAPIIEFGGPRPRLQKTTATSPLESQALPDIADITGRRWLFDGKTRIPPAKRIDADMVFTGTAWIGDGTRVHGSLKGHKDLYLGEGVQILGSVVSVHDIYIGPGCEIHGPVLSEKSVYVGKGVIIGEPNGPTTVSARDITVSDGAVAHGTVWARLHGTVNSETEA